MAAKLRKGDKVVVLAGKDKGKEGTIESVNPKRKQGCSRWHQYGHPSYTSNSDISGRQTA